MKHQTIDLAELWQALDADSDGLTARELGSLWNVGRNRVLNVLGRAKEAGWLEVGRKRAERLDGQVTWRPCYSIRPTATPPATPRSGEG